MNPTALLEFEQAQKRIVAKQLAYAHRPRVSSRNLRNVLLWLALAGVALWMAVWRWMP